MSSATVNAKITAALDTQTATIFDKKTGVAVSGWTDKDIDGANGNLVTSGDGVWDLPASATAKVDDRLDYEVHVIVMRFTYDTAWTKNVAVHAIHDTKGLSTQSATCCA